MKKIFTILFGCTIMALASCKKDKGETPVTKIDIDQTAVTMHYDEQHQFALSSNTTTMPTSASWSSSDTTVGTINSKGLFSAKKIGTTTITAAGTGYTLTAAVTVAPYYNLFQEPYAVLGTDSVTVRTKEARKFAGKLNLGVSSYEEDVLISYYGENTNVNLVQYGFVNNKLNNTAVELVTNNDKSYVDKVMTFFKERYAPYPNSTNTKVLANFKGTYYPNERISVNASYSPTAITINY